MQGTALIPGFLLSSVSELSLHFLQGGSLFCRDSSGHIHKSAPCSSDTADTRKDCFLPPRGSQHRVQEDRRSQV